MDLPNTSLGQQSSGGSVPLRDISRASANLERDYKITIKGRTVSTIAAVGASPATNSSDITSQGVQSVYWACQQCLDRLTHRLFRKDRCTNCGCPYSIVVPEWEKRSLSVTLQDHEVNELDTVWGTSTAVSDRVAAARSRVKQYYRLVGDACSSWEEAASLLDGRYDIGIFSVKVITIQPDGNCDTHHPSSLVDLLGVLERLMDENGAQGSAASCWTYIVVEDLTPEVIGLLGGFLEIPPRFFLGHMAGGGIMDETATGDIGAHPNADRTCFDDDRGREGEVNWSRHTWQRVIRNLEQFEWDKCLCGQHHSWNSEVHVESIGIRVGYHSSAFINNGQAGMRQKGGGGKAADVHVSSQPHMNHRCVHPRIFRPISAIGLHGSQLSFVQERLSSLWTNSPVSIGLVLVDTAPLRARNSDGTEFQNSVLVDRWPDDYRSTSLGSCSTLDKVVSEVRIAGTTVRQLPDSSDRVPSVVLKHMEVGVLTSIARFWGSGFHVLNSSLADIDLTLGKNVQSKASEVADWQSLLAIWRSRLPQMYLDLEGTKFRIEELRTTLPVIHERIVSFSYPQLLSRCILLQERTERTLQALMSSMSVLESQNALKQGSEIQKLTELAFVFIPISFVAAYFGMEVQDWDGDQKPNLRSFWAFACCLLLGMYIMRLVFYGRNYLELREKLRMEFAVWNSYRPPPPETDGIPNFLEFIVFSTMRSIAWSPSKVPKIFRAWLFRTLFGLTVLLYVPVALLWGLRPLSWPQYIPLSLTLGWVLVYNAALVAYRAVDGPDSPLHHINSSLSVLHLLPTAMFTLSYPALMINVGDIPGTESWSRSVRILPATVVPVVMFVALLGMKAMRLRD